MNNYAKSYTVIMYSAPTPSYGKSLNINITNSAFINNTMGDTSKYIIWAGSSSSKVYLDNNWWGTNDGFPDRDLSYSVSVTSWIIMDATAVTSNTNPDNTFIINVTFDKVKNTAGEISDLEGSVVDGLIVNFTTTAGTLADDYALTVNGTANNTLTSTTQALVTVTQANEELTIRAVPPADYTLTVEFDSNIVAPDHNIILGYFKDADNNPVIGKDVTITINGVDYNVTTDENGYYEYDYSPTFIGVNNLTVKYVTYTPHTLSYYYANVTEEYTFNVRIRSIALSLIGVNTTMENESIMYGYLIDEFDKPVVGIELTFQFDGITPPVSIVTDENGYFSYNATLGLGQHLVTASYDGGLYYTSVYNESVFYVTQRSVNISVVAQNVTFGFNSTISGKLTDQYDLAVANARLSILIDGNYVAQVYTNDDGEFTYVYTPTTSGIYTVTVVYAGTSYGTYASNSSSVELNVSKVKSVVNVASTPVKVVSSSSTGTTVISGRLVDEFGGVFEEVEVTLYLNDEKLITLTTDANGYYSYEFTSEILSSDTHSTANLYEGVNTLSVKYDGNSTYDECENTSFVYVSDNNLIINVPSTTRLCMTAAITGTLIDSDNNGISNANIRIIIGSVVYTTQTDANGAYSYNFGDTASLGEYDVIVQYYSGDDVLLENRTVFTVTKHVTSIGVDIGTVKLNKTTTITLSLLREDESSIEDGVLLVYINGDNYANLTTGDNGLVSFDYMPVLSGENTISVIYEGDDSYVESDKDSTFEVLNINTSIDLVVTNVTYGEVSVISVILKDENENKLSTAIITLTINTVAINVITDQNGVFTYNYTSLFIGQNNVSVDYAGSNVYASSNASTTFVLAENNTNINVTSNATLNGVKLGDKINITGYLTYQENKPLLDKQVKIILNNQVISEVTTNSVGGFELEYTTQVVGLNIITVQYYENDYLKVDNTTTFTVIASMSNMTVNANEVTLGQKTTITGLLNDEHGNVIPNAIVEITLNDNLVARVGTDSNGLYSYEIITTIAGENNVSVHYIGSNSYNESTNTTKFNVISLGTVINVIASNVTLGEIVNINGRLVTSEGLALSNANIIIKINTLQDIIVTTDNMGMFSYELYTSTTIGTNNVTVIYEKTNNYNYSTNNTTFNVERYESPKVPTTLTLTTKETNITRTTTINGTLTNGTTGIANATISITINGVNIKNTTTNANGIYSYTYNATNVGNNTVSVSYAGNESYNSSTASGILVVNKIATTISLNFGSLYVGVNTFTGNVTSATGGRLANVVVRLTSGGATAYAITNSTGGYTINWTVTSSGAKTFTATYTGNGTYNNISTTKNATANKLTAKVTVNKITARINDTITLRATVIGSDGKNATNGTVTFLVNGKAMVLNNKTITANVVNGVAEVNITVPTLWYTNKSNLSARYNGNYAINTNTSSNTTMNITLHKATIQLLAEAGPFKAGDTVKLRIIVHEGDTLVSNGRVTFKLNGITLKDSKGNAIYADVKNGVGEITWTIPDGYTAATYKLTGVFGGGIYERYEQSTSITIAKSATHLNTSVYTTSTNKIRIKADIFDGNNVRETGSSRVSVKIGGVTVISSATVYNGTIDLNVTMNLKAGLYTVEIIAGENSAYQGTRTTTYLIRT